MTKFYRIMIHNDELWFRFLSAILYYNHDQGDFLRADEYIPSASELWSVLRKEQHTRKWTNDRSSPRWGGVRASHVKNSST